MNNEQEILTLTDREKCRLRTPVFMGSFDCRMINLNEILMNARDEVNTNFESGEIHIELKEDMKTITIRDTGRGIPIRGVDQNGTKKSDLIFKTLFSGCNFQNITKTNGDSFIENCGQNGAGLTTTQYISTFLQGTQILNYEAYEVTYRNGGLEEEDRYYTSEFEHGTIITYSLDPTVVTNIYYTYEEVLDTVRRVASTTKDKIKYVFKHKDETIIFNYESFEEYFEENFSSISPIVHFNEKVTTFDSTRDGQKFKEGNRIEVLLSLSTEPEQETYLNGGYLPEQGTFYKGIIEGIRKTFQKEIKTKVKLTDNDVIMSFNIYGLMGSNNPVYSNQTKKASSNEVYKKIASSYIADNMLILKTEKPKLFETMLKHLTTINTLNEKTEKGRSAIKKQLEERVASITTRPKKLVPCRSKNPNEVELILIEGDSAMNSVKLGRDPNTMMVYPLKGKPINPLKKSIDAILSNDEIVDVFKIIGCGITYKGKNVKGFPPFNIDNLNVSKIVIATDFDEDGFHIQSLLIGIFYMLAPQLLVENKIEFVKTPLYSIKQKGKEYFAYSEMDRYEVLKEIAKNGGYKETRWKGLGGIPTSTMSTCLNKETRISTVVTMEDAKKCAEMIELFLSDDIEKRKEYIEKYGHEYVTESMLV